jgi:hypothetical protein
MEMPLPSEQERHKFFEPLFTKYAMKDVDGPQTNILAPLPEVLEEVSAPAPRKLSEVELKKIRKKEDRNLRELRLFLRDILQKLYRDKRFSIFVEPVDVEEVKDYAEVISKPMDLDTMMYKIDQASYDCAEHFLDDIKLIQQNALDS